MQVTVDDSSTPVVVSVQESRIDAAIATRFKDRMREIVVKMRKPMLIDMTAVDFMDSSGLGAMISVRKAMPDGMRLSLRGLTPNVERVFRLTRMDAVFDIQPETTPPPKERSE